MNARTILPLLLLAAAAALAGCSRKPAPAPDPAADPGPPAARERVPDKEVVNSVGMKLVLVPAGSFTFGSPKSEPGHQTGEFGDETQHPVTIARPFYMGVYEVTGGEFEKVMGFTRAKAASDKGGALDLSKHPAAASPKEAAEFCAKLSARPAEQAAGRVYRLPTEAEWEYACRAGSKAAYSYGDDPAKLGEYAWYAGNARYAPQPVGKRKPNAFGLYDMHGNVSEWCTAKFVPGKDPQAAGRGEAAMSRGGDITADPAGCRCAARSPVLDLTTGGLNTGFRVVCLVPGGK
jgi:formylglycine-generating enzyme required for sulfatase activity